MNVREDAKLAKAIETLKNPGGGMKLVSHGWVKPEPEPKRRLMPAQRPGKSVQIVRTPRDLLDAIEKRFGKLTFDLAATRENSVVPGGCFYGSGSLKGTDTLAKSWSDIRGNLWLNPEFGQIKHYAAKCFMTLNEKPRGRVFLLIPASVGSNWWRDYIDKKAATFFLNPRVTFVGHEFPYPKDLALCVFGAPPGYECWRWK